ncbi:hypothetical protein BCV70DRAFT_206752 [Testicularia cyperi]|uniref:Pyridoxal phosphate homeostasis protein n=1 Tax=Testicularia cyperi TaxID=1882483 RepID=A0A317XNV2_9BASI|nr:hypothetical protein BCV70DRAFT_206752 [Testicularia cyperi]
MEAISDFAKRAGNEALSVNRPVADIDITTAGSSFLWAVFSVMAATGLGTMVWSLKVSRGERAFHYLSAAILATASVAYFAMASDLGATPVLVEFYNYAGDAAGGARPTRSIWYARYIDWTITTPLLLLEILLVSGLPLSTVFITIFFDLVMIITGLIGALVESTYKWGFYTFGCVAMFYVFYILYVPGLKSASHLGDDFKKAYLYSAMILTGLWFLYPIAWGLADGGNVISPNGEMVFYGVLDLLAKPGFALFHLFSLRRCNYSSLHLKSGKFSDYEDLGAAHYRNMRDGKAAEAGLAGDHHTTNVNGTTMGTGSTIEPAPAMRQAQVTHSLFRPQPCLCTTEKLSRGYLFPPYSSRSYILTIWHWIVPEMRTGGGMIRSIGLALATSPKRIIRRSFATSLRTARMVPDTEFTSALAKPLETVQSIYAKAQDKSAASVVKVVESHFRDTFSSDDARAKIPTLSPSSIASLLAPPSSNTAPSASHPLVRFRCMVQDTGLGTEVFLASHTQDGVEHTGLFGGEARFPVPSADESNGQQAFSNDNLTERTIMYAVSTPGQTEWAARAHRDRSGGPSHSSRSPASSSSTSSDGDISAQLANLSLMEDPPAPQKVQEVRERIRRAVDKGKSLGSTGKEPRLVAISKLHPPSAILAAHRKAGQLHFGENYVQEMVDKAKVLPREIRWHFVGGLQSNKGKLLASIPNLYLLETLDSIKAANVLQKALSSPDAAKRDEPLQVYLQVNTSGEDAKSGLPPITSADDDGKQSALLDLAVHVITKCPNLRFRGVMTIGAATNSANVQGEALEPKSVDDVVKANPDFERLIQTRRNLVRLLRSDDRIKASNESQVKEAYTELLDGSDSSADGGLELSMGMSADVDVAIMAGSDNVRVGTDCFGRRPGTRDEAMTGMKRELEIGPEQALVELRNQVQGAQQSTTSSNSAAIHDDGQPTQTASSRSAYPQKSPVPESNHIGALVKFNDLEAAESFKTAELIDVVGILDTGSLPQIEWQDTGAGQQGSSSEAPQVPCVHAILANSVDLNDVPAAWQAGSASFTSALSSKETRAELIEYIAGALAGDNLAAELVLLSITARIHARRAGLCLGALSLNISNFPAPPSSQASSSSSSSSSGGSVPETELYRRLAQLLPALVDIPMDLGSLNDPSKSLFPRSSGEGVGLEAGRLQLPSGTTIVINEGGMREGQLQDAGIRNIRALSFVLESHKLPYAFPYSEFEFDTDLNAVILSQGKSFLPFDIQCPLQAQSSDVQNGLYSPSSSAQSTAVPEDKLAQWRRSLLEARSLKTAQTFQIPESVSEHIQKEFVEDRRRQQAASSAAVAESHGGGGKSDAASGQEDLLRRMALVRLLAISRAQSSLTVETWNAAVELDTRLNERIQAQNQNQQSAASQPSISR